MMRRAHASIVLSIAVLASSAIACGQAAACLF
jgi:hypothetical protein